MDKVTEDKINEFIAMMNTAPTQVIKYVSYLRAELDKKDTLIKSLKKELDGNGRRKRKPTKDTGKKDS